MKTTITIFILLSVFSSLTYAQSNQEKSKNTITFGVVPQQSASKLARLWTPILQHIGKNVGIKIKFKTAKNIPAFEKQLKKGNYDLSYMNPYHYTVYSQSPGYIAFAKALNKKIKGILVVKKDSKLNNMHELDGETLAFPAPAAFAATVLPRAYFIKQKIEVKEKYVSSHDSVYRNVAKGLFPAGGGVIRTFKNTSPEIREQLKILWTSNGFTPHALAAHPHINKQLLQKIQTEFVNLQNTDKGKKLLESIKIKGITEAKDSDWDDVRGLNINLLK